MGNDPQRRQTVLLAIIAGLLLSNTLALLLGGLWVRSQVQEALGAKEGPVAALTENLETTRKMAQELTERQAALAAGLDEVARRTSVEMKALQERRNDLGGVKRGPLEKVDQIIGLMQLLSDELMVMIKHLSTTQGVLARSAKPGPAQRDLILEPPAPSGDLDGGTK